MRRLKQWLVAAWDAVLLALCLAGYAVMYAAGLVVVCAFWVVWNAGCLGKRAWGWACRRAGMGD